MILLLLPVQAVPINIRVSGCRLSLYPKMHIELRNRPHSKSEFSRSRFFCSIPTSSSNSIPTSLSNSVRACWPLYFFGRLSKILLVFGSAKFSVIGWFAYHIAWSRWHGNPGKTVLASFLFFELIHLANEFEPSTFSELVQSFDVDLCQNCWVGFGLLFGHSLPPLIGSPCWGFVRSIIIRPTLPRCLRITFHAYWTGVTFSARGSLSFRLVVGQYRTVILVTRKLTTYKWSPVKSFG